jgi:hypothetical protein
MSQGFRLLQFILMFVGPWAATYYVIHFDVKNAGSDQLPVIGAILLASFVVTVVTALRLKRIATSAASTRIARAGLANLVFVILDIAIFALLVYGRSRPACDLGPDCATFPVVWLTLAGMHFCYATVGYLVKAKSAL